MASLKSRLIQRAQELGVELEIGEGELEAVAPKGRHFKATGTRSLLLATKDLESRPVQTLVSAAEAYQAFLDDMAMGIEPCEPDCVH